MDGVIARHSTSSIGLAIVVVVVVVLVQAQAARDEINLMLAVGRILMTLEGSGQRVIAGGSLS